MQFREVRWLRALSACLVAEVGQIAATICGWRFIVTWSILAQTEAVYEAHAQVAGPWVSIPAGTPIFYAASRWIAKSRVTAWAMFGLFLVLEVVMVARIGVAWRELPYLVFALSYVTKILACDLGGRNALRTVLT